MKKIHKKTVLLSILGIFAAILLIVICLFWSVIRSGAGVKYLEDGTLTELSIKCFGTDISKDQ